jgi:hypothetical protein
MPYSTAVFACRWNGGADVLPTKSNDGTPQLGWNGRGGHVVIGSPDPSDLTCVAVVRTRDIVKDGMQAVSTPRWIWLADVDDADAEPGTPQAWNQDRTALRAWFVARGYPAIAVNAAITTARLATRAGLREAIRLLHRFEDWQWDRCQTS